MCKLSRFARDPSHGQNAGERALLHKPWQQLEGELYKKNCKLCRS
jgi:hypothetical protein